MKKNRQLRVLFGLEAADGGALKHLSYLVSSLDPDSFSVTVILSAKRSEKVSPEIIKMQDAGAAVLLLSMERQINLWKDAKSFLLIFFHLMNHRYDIVHAHSSKAGFLFRLAAWINRVPTIIYTPHCFYFQAKTGIKRTFFVWLEKLMGKITHHIIVSNTEKIWAINYHIVTPLKLKSINNAIDFNEYPLPSNGESAKPFLGLKDDLLVVGAIGRLVEQKDWLTYIYAAKEILQHFSNVAFLLVGEGVLLNDLKKKIKQLELEDKIIITGHSSEVSKIYSAIDIFVSTSLWEGLPYVLLEAMWFKKPIVATNLGYHNIIYDNENGFLVEVKDYKILAEKIQALIKNKAMSIEMGERGHHLVKSSFSFNEFVKKHEVLYLSCFKDKET